MREVTDCVQKVRGVKISNCCLHCSIWGLNKATNCLSGPMSHLSLECLLLCYYEWEKPVGGPCSNMQATEKEQKVRKQVRERESDMLVVTEWMALQQGRTVGLDETMVCLKDVSLSVWNRITPWGQDCLPRWTKWDRQPSSRWLLSKKTLLITPFNHSRGKVPQLNLYAPVSLHI